ncbi:MAG: hypothetical protein ABEH66_01765 [Halobacteriales archaeon]
MTETHGGFESLMHRASRDESFLMRFRDDPEATIEPYDLDAEMADAVVDGDERRIYDVLGDLTATVFTVTLVLIYRKD